MYFIPVSLEKMSGFVCSFCDVRLKGQDEMRLHIRSSEHELKIREANLDPFVQGPKKTVTVSFSVDPLGMLAGITSALDERYVMTLA